MGDVLGFVGQIGAAEIQSSAAERATQAQLDALNQQRNFVFQNLQPSTINAQATQADVQQTLSQLELQRQIDPGLAAARQAAGSQIAAGTAGIGATSNPIAAQAAAEATSGVSGAAGSTSAQGKQQLIDAALQQLKLGATLPPDVEAQLVQSGLEQSGMVTQSASGQGIGGQLQRQILGTAGIQLQMQRQQQAQNLLMGAQNLETSRANILQSLFPNLAQTQLANLQGAEGAFNTSNAAAPNVGLSGTNVANLWLARVGATNQLTQSAANAAAQGAMAQGTIWGQAVGGAARAAGGALPTASQLWSSLNTNTGAGGVAPGADQQSQADAQAAASII
jgi:hypothetical protein